MWRTQEGLKKRLREERCLVAVGCVLGCGFEDCLSGRGFKRYGRERAPTLVVHGAFHKLASSWSRTPRPRPPAVAIVFAGFGGDMGGFWGKGEGGVTGAGGRCNLANEYAQGRARSRRGRNNKWKKRAPPPLLPWALRPVKRRPAVGRTHRSRPRPRSRRQNGPGGPRDRG